MDFERGRLSAIVGPSGSGKSTLLHCIAGFDTLHRRRRPGPPDDRRLTRLRRDRIGFVFQAFNLLPTLAAAENITLPLALAGKKPDQQWLDLVIDVVGLRDRLGHRPAELTGGQQQRVAVARSLVTRRRSSSPTSPPATWTPGRVDEFGQTIALADFGAAEIRDRTQVLAASRKQVDTLLLPVTALLGLSPAWAPCWV